MKAVGGGGFWRLEMRLGLVLGYGNAFQVESVQWGGGKGRDLLERGGGVQGGGVPPLPEHTQSTGNRKIIGE